jgi:hypothetical protein
MMFWSIVGHAIRQTTGPIGPSTIERSNFLGLGATSGTGSPVYYADFRLSDYRFKRGNAEILASPPATPISQLDIGLVANRDNEVELTRRETMAVFKGVRT